VCLSEHTAFKQCNKNEKINKKKLIRKINNKPPTQVTVAQLPLNSKKAITQLQSMRFKEVAVFTEKLSL
jgi:hypothetical protein